MAAGGLDGRALRRWLDRSDELLAAARPRLDALNVFPVPDADTGTNLAVTIHAAAGAAGAPADLAECAMRAADAAARRAQGSSGTILAEYLRGFAGGLPDESGDAADLRGALAAAAEAAWAAVGDPVEGTILSVARAAAKAAFDADPGSLSATAAAAAGGARDELFRTPQELPVLAAAGVVDAGAAGLVLVLDALCAVLGGDVEPLELPEPAAVSVASCAPDTGYAYEVMYLLEAAPDVVPGLRDRLARIGDSVVVGAAGDVHTVHVHVDDVGAAIEAGIDVGRPSRIRVTRFADRVEASGETLVVAITPPGGLADVFRFGGASVVEAVAADDVAADDILAAVRAATGRVVVLPNARGAIAVAEDIAASARAQRRNVTVVPTRSPLQGLAALAVHDPHRGVDDDVVAMSAAAAATRYAEVTRAEHDALTTVGRCRAGDVLGLIDDDVAVIGDDVTAIARELLDRLLSGGGELVTLVVGDSAPQDLAAELERYVVATRPAVEVVNYAGSGLRFPLLLGVE